MADSKSGQPIMATTFDASKEGFAAFHQAALLADEVGYDLIALTPLGVKSFGAVWKKTGSKKAPQERDILVWKTYENTSTIAVRSVVEQ